MFHSRRERLFYYCMGKVALHRRISKCTCAVWFHISSSQNIGQNKKQRIKQIGRDGLQLEKYRVHNHGNKTGNGSKNACEVISAQKHFESFISEAGCFSDRNSKYIERVVHFCALFLVFLNLSGWNFADGIGINQEIQLEFRLELR